MCSSILFFLSLSGILFSASSPIKFDHISLEQGLSQSTVTCIFQDSKGFMWFGTEDGLNKYDGYTFKFYKYDPKNSNSLNNNLITSICEDKSGFLWIGTMGGINRFDRKKEKITRFTHDPNNPSSLASKKVFSILVDRSGTLWIGTWDKGLDRYDPETGGFIHYRLNPANEADRLNHNFVNAIYEDRGGELWIGTDGGGLKRLDRERKTFTHYQSDLHNPGDAKNLSINHVFSIHEDYSRNLWIGTKKGLDRFHREKQEFIHIPSTSPTPEVNAIQGDRLGILWFATWNQGLSRLDPNTGKIITYRADPTDPDSINSNEILSFYMDESGIMWVGTKRGINKFEPEKTKFTHYKKQPNNTNSLNDNDVRAICEDKNIPGVFWIGTTNGGLNRFDMNTETFSHYQNKPGDPTSLSHNYILTIYQDRSGILWIGTSGGGLNKFNPKTGKSSHYKSESKRTDSLSNNIVTSIIEDRFGISWIGTYGGGLNHFDPRTGTFFPYKHHPDDPRSLSSDYIHCLYEDRLGVLWIGTADEGLNRFERENQTFIRYQPSEEEPTSLSHNTILSIYESRSGILWIGTAGGINRFNRQSQSFLAYKEKDGLPNDVINAILEDDRGNLWISTNKGLSKFNPIEETFRNYNIKDGIQGYEFNAGAAYKGKDKKMYFGGLNGFNVFHPADIKDSIHKPKIVITSFKKFNDEAKLQEHISEIEEIQVSHRDSISFEFAALDFSDPPRNQYAYLLEGQNDDWIQLGNTREITFPGLAPGDYTLRIKGSNSNRVWNNEGTFLKIKVTPPFWRTWWFGALGFFIIISFLVVLIRHRFKRLRFELKKEQAEMKRKMEKERLENELKLKADYTAMLVHDLRSPLAAITGYADFLATHHSRGELEKIGIEKIGSTISRSAERMLRLINDMLDISKFEAGKMSILRKDASIVVLAKEISAVMAPLMNKKKLRIEFQFVDLPKIAIDPERISQVINNFISNAIKFSPKNGVITLKTRRLTIEGKHFQELSVTDTGPGVPRDKQKFLFDKYAQVHKEPTAKGTGLGLAVSRLIIEAHDGFIGYESQESQKNTFFFRIPEAETDSESGTTPDSEKSQVNRQIA